MRKERDIDVSRRSLGALLGALGAGAGLRALSGCAERAAEASPEQTDQVSEALASSPGVLSVATVLGATRPGARTGVLATSRGPGPGPATVPSINSCLVVALGCVRAGDGGGAVFAWMPRRLRVTTAARSSSRPAAQAGGSASTAGRST